MLIYWQFVALDLFVFWFLFDSVQLIVHAIEEESQELLSILLAIAAELASYAAYLLFEFTGCDRAASAQSSIFEESVVRVGKPPGPYRLLTRVVRHEILSQRRCCENALKDRIHEARVAYVAEAGGTIAVAFGNYFGYGFFREIELVGAGASESALESFLRALQRRH